MACHRKKEKNITSQKIHRDEFLVVMLPLPPGIVDLRMRCAAEEAVGMPLKVLFPSTDP